MKPPYSPHKPSLPYFKNRLGFVLLFTISCISILTTLAITLSYQVKPIHQFSSTLQRFTLIKTTLKNTQLFIQNLLLTSPLLQTPNSANLSFKTLPSEVEQTQNGFTIKYNSTFHATVTISDEGSRIPLHTIPLQSIYFPDFPQLQKLSKKLQQTELRNLSSLTPSFCQLSFLPFVSTQGPFTIPLVPLETARDQLSLLDYSDQDIDIILNEFRLIQEYLKNPTGSPPPSTLQALIKKLSSLNIAWTPELSEIFSMKSSMNINNIPSSIISSIFQFFESDITPILPSLISLRTHKTLKSISDLQFIQGIFPDDILRLNTLFSYQPTLIRADISLYEEDLLIKNILYFYKIDLSDQSNKTVKLIGVQTISC